MTVSRTEIMFDQVRFSLTLDGLKIVGQFVWFCLEWVSGGRGRGGVSCCYPSFFTEVKT